MTEEIAATPAWVEHRLDEVFAALPKEADLAGARAAYLVCLGSRKAPAAPSDLLGEEFAPCRQALHTHLQKLRLDPDAIAALDTRLEVLEAEFAGAS